MESHLSIEQLENIFWRATVVCLGLDPDDSDARVQSRVRISWPSSDSGNSDWGRDENVVFLRISPGADPYGTLRDVSYEPDGRGGTKEVVRYHRHHQINWVCYGPHSDEDADAIRIGIMQDSIHDDLMRHRLAMIPGIAEPVRIPEIDESGEWWDRCDLAASCYESAVREYKSGSIETLPQLHIDS